MGNTTENLHQLLGFSNDPLAWLPLVAPLWAYAESTYGQVRTHVLASKRMSLTSVECPIHHPLFYSSITADYRSVAVPQVCL